MNDAGLAAMREYMLDSGLVVNPPERHAIPIADTNDEQSELLKGVTYPAVKVTVETAMVMCDDGQYHSFDLLTVTL